MEESTRQNLVMAFSNVMRTSSLAGVVDLQRASLAFGSMLEHDSGGDLQLQPLYDFLIEQGGPKAGVIEVIVFLKSREARFGMQMVLPPDLAALSAEEREAIVTTFTTRGATSGTRAGRTPGQTTGTHARTQSGPLVVPGSVSMPAAGATTGAGSRSGTFKPPEPEFVPPTSSPSSAKRKLLIAAVVVAAVGLGNIVFSMVTAPPPWTPLTLNDPAGLPCTTATANNDTVICKLEKAFYDGNTPAAIDARAAITRSMILSKGYKKLLVMTSEDSKVRRVY